MSLILEALKKSEEQRQRGELPTLSTRHPTPRRRRGLWPLLGLLTLAVFAAAVLVWRLDLLPQQAPDATADLPAIVPALPEPAEVPASAAAPAELPPAAEPAASGLPPVAASQSLDIRPETERESLPMPPEMERLTTVDTSAAVERGDAFASNPDLRRPFEHTPESERDGAVDARMAELLDRQAAQPESPLPMPAAPGSPRHGDLQMLHELPFALRRDLPTLRLTVHAYSADPDRRFVIVNGERRGEGEALAAELEIEQIVPEGVVLRFRGERALLPRLGG